MARQFDPFAPYVEMTPEEQYAEDMRDYHKMLIGDIAYFENMPGYEAKVINAHVENARRRRGAMPSDLLVDDDIPF